MPNRVQWDPSFSVGHEAIDEQHRHIVARCNALADHVLRGDGEDAERTFRHAFDELMTLAREHFAAEERLLAGCGYPELEDYRCECEEFDYLAAEIMTPENFDKLELQRFLALWWVGHIMGAARQQAAFLKQKPAA